ncbi:hypothetical protein [Novosphingobium resinovorum]|uniref:hypothetical protein n=1 Tax=Novosphingobium resinovorum TaxID=158500 RepID=UPI002ED35A9D|nr:hypothetical protein [Novosphingobium resinovorum]
MTNLPTPHDPAKARFFIINVVRMGGVMFVVLGMLVATGRIWTEELGSGGKWVGYLLLVFGLVDTLILPLLLTRKWRTPK